MPAAPRYKAALAAMALMLPAAGRAEKGTGATLPDSAKPIGEHRYRLASDYEDTLKYFKTVYPPAKYTRKPIANLPGIKAFHIENPDTRPGSWEGLNVYEKDGEVRVFVLVTPGEEPKKKKRPQR